MTPILSYAKFVREKYTYIILTTWVIAVVVGLFTASPGVHIRQINTPLIVIMIAAMGFTITFKSLGRLAQGRCSLSHTHQRRYHDSGPFPHPVPHVSIRRDICQR